MDSGRYCTGVFGSPRTLKDARQGRTDNLNAVCPTPSRAPLRYKIGLYGRILAVCNMEIRPMKNDTQIQQEVLTELEQDEFLPTGSIGVEVHHGVVKLAGRISDPETKKRAALDARRVEGVTGIILDMGIERR
jgi:hypothetical protein